MCGISGIYNLDGKAIEPFVLDRMTKALTHRGPDDWGYAFFKSESQTGMADHMSFQEISLVLGETFDLGFGHRRLSIIDLSHYARQPMSNEDKSIWIICNGTIYNYIELTSELKSLGHVFKTKCDTEVILHAYEEYGIECLHRFNGAWAFALWDANCRLLFCARDRFGKKPLYYFYNKDKFIFASEIKSILMHPQVDCQPNNYTIYNYLSQDFGFVDISENTFFEGIKQILPSHYALINDKKLQIKRYWDLDFSHKLQGIKEEVYRYRFNEVFEDSVRIRLRSDVPIGFCLSGGLDSSSVTSMAYRILGKSGMETFSSCFEDKEYDERRHAYEVISQVDGKPHMVFPSVDGLYEALPALIWHQEEPFSNLNIYSEWEIMKAAKETGIVVILNGHGGDEGLNGYVKELSFYLADLIKDLKLKELIKEVRIFAKSQDFLMAKGIFSAFKIILASFIPISLKDVLRIRFAAKNKVLNPEFVQAYENYFHFDKAISTFLDKSSYMGYRIAPLPGWIHAEDRTSMAFSIESRSPFLDYRLVEFLAALPYTQKIRNGISKYILRQSLKGILPEHVRMRRDKKGFLTPTDIWLSNDMKEWALSIFNSQSFRNRGYFNYREVLKAFDSHRSGKVNLRFAIWSWLNLELWFQKFVHKDSLMQSAKTKSY